MTRATIMQALVSRRRFEGEFGDASDQVDPDAEITLPDDAELGAVIESVGDAPFKRGASGQSFVAAWDVDTDNEIAIGDAIVMDENASIGTELDTVLVDVPLPPSSVPTITELPKIDEQLERLKVLLASQSVPTPVDPDEKTAPIDVPPLPVEKRTDSAPGKGRTDRRG